MDQPDPADLPLRDRPRDPALRPWRPRRRLVAAGDLPGERQHPDPAGRSVAPATSATPVLAPSKSGGACRRRTPTETAGRSLESSGTGRSRRASPDGAGPAAPRFVDRPPS